MVKKSSMSRNADEKTAKQQILPVASPMTIRWVDSGARLENLGHGVQFLHDDFQHSDQNLGDSNPGATAFVEGFDWYHRPGSAATVRIISIGPTSITTTDWEAIIRSTREAVLAYILDAQAQPLIPPRTDPDLD